MSSESDISFFRHRPKYKGMYETTSGLQIPVKTMWSAGASPGPVASCLTVRQHFRMVSWRIEWKSHSDTRWLNDTPSQPLQQSLKDLERGYKNFFLKRAAYPRLKKRGQNDAFRYPQGVKLDQTNSRISLPESGWIRCRNSREGTGEVKNVTVSQSCGKWCVSIRTEYEVPEPAHNAASMVGLDAGVTKLATLSDGTVYQPVNSFKANQRRLAVLRRQLSRKVKFSTSWQKQK